jgi:hypothetical protein
MLSSLQVYPAAGLIVWSMPLHQRSWSHFVHAAAFTAFALMTTAGCSGAGRPIIFPFAPQEVAGTGWTVIGAAAYQRTAQYVVLESGSLRSLDVGVITGNPDSQGDGLTLTVEMRGGKVVARVTQVLDVGTTGWVRFPVKLTMPPGTELVVRLSEERSQMFGWRYRTNPRHAGRGIMLGRDDGQYDFLCRVNP